ncbi:hypothetical protein FOMPIDRAFT_91989 [Fomitopsis schrenkii]|uniref:Uncharacterized protein n=1 Tax=Fomitopsis schrenkii TaxID=2126942 RepID=S8DHS7_FOMSC|nr:hypothetical protein FOMPIDRAFT_91989 [Fomitopsis schrenkii]
MLDNIPSYDENASAEDDPASNNESTRHICEGSPGSDDFAIYGDCASSFGGHNSNDHAEVDTNALLSPGSPIPESILDPLHDVPELQAILCGINQELEATQHQISQLQDEVMSLRGDMQEALRYLRDMAHQ